MAGEISNLGVTTVGPGDDLYQAMGLLSPSFITDRQQPPPFLVVDRNGNAELRARVPSVESRLDKLLAILGLTAVERAFINSEAENPGNGRDWLLVVADWLDEHGQEARAAAIREAESKRTGKAEQGQGQSQSQVQAARIGVDPGPTPCP